MTLDIWLSALPVVLTMGCVTWLYSIYRKNVNIVDSLWSLMFLSAATIYLIGASDTGLRNMLIYCLVVVWASRLSLFLMVRNSGQPEDRRYREIRANNEPFWINSLYIVFGLQALLAWLISIPLVGALSVSATISVLDIIAVLMWIAGFLYESISDLQLYQFNNDPNNRGRVLDTGLWRYSRHPNYFGEALIWWSFFIFGIQYSEWWIIYAPILMTLLLLKVSGVALMEKTIASRRAGYAQYIERTNAFFPWFPRSISREGLQHDS